MKNPHRIVREIFDGLNDNQIHTISKLSGVGVMTLRSWKHDRRTPRIDLFEAVANAAGFDVVLQPKELITMHKTPRAAAKGTPRLVPNGNKRIDVYMSNHMIGYVDDELLFGIDGKGFASEIGFVGHRVEIIPKLTAWRAAQGIAA